MGKKSGLTEKDNSLIVFFIFVLPRFKGLFAIFLKS